MKKIIIMAIAALALGFTAQAQTTRPVTTTQHQKSTMERHHDTSQWSKLNLTQDQRNQMQTSRKDFMQQRETIRNDKTLNAQQRDQKLSELNKSQKEKMHGYLTPEQQKQMRSWKNTDRNDRMNDRMKNKKMRHPAVKDTMNK